MILGGAPPSAAESAEEKAALALFNQGREAFKAGKIDEAIPLLESALQVIDNPYIRYFLGTSYAAANRCSDAVPILATLAGTLPDDIEAKRASDTSRCQLSEARARVEADDCKGAMPHLEALAGTLDPEQEKWREEKAAYCEPRSKEFTTDTPLRAAAHDLFLAARAAGRAGNGSKATALYEKALQLADEPIIRRELALVVVATRGCAIAADLLRGIPGPVREQADKDLETACGELAPKAALEPARMKPYADQIMGGLKARREGRLAEAHTAFAAASRTGVAPAVEVIVIDLLFELKRCRAYGIAMTDAAKSVRLAVTDGRARLATCGIDAQEVGFAALGARRPGGPANGVMGSLASADRTVAWSVLGGGVLLAGTALVQLAMASDAQSEADGHAAVFDSPTDPDDAVAAFAAMGDAKGRASDARTSAAIVGFAGAAALVTGAVLYFTNDSGSPASGESSTTFATPVLGPNYLGVRASF
jgi:tetratricopeptide (TPR) repeat protein